MNSTVSPPRTATAPPEISAARLLLVRSEGSKTPLTGPEASPQTVGAGPRCSIRLDGPGLRPLHCVITPTDEGAVIRRWAAETRLNGDDFTEARLSAGDIVRVGSIDLRVVELLPSPPEFSSQKEQEPNEVDALAAEPSDEALEGEPLESEVLRTSAIQAAAAWEEPAPIDEAPLATANEPASDSADVAESIAQTLADVEVAVETIDPAIPSHLLKPWGGCEGEELVATRETATTAVPLDAFDAPAQEPTEVASQVPEPAVAPLDGEWAVSASDTREAAKAAEPAVALSPEWQIAPAEAATPTPAPGAAVIQEEVEEASTVPEEPLAEASLDPAQAATKPSHEGRLASDRLRVKSLVAALRAEREQATLWQTAVAEREAALLAAQEQITEASAAAERNEATRQELVEANERIVALEAECAEALAAAEAATERAEALEQQLAEQAAPVIENVEAVAEETFEAETEAEEAAELAENTEEPTPPAPEMPEAISSLWTQESAPETPETEAVAEISNVSVPETPAELEAPVQAEVAAEPTASEGLWGIEQLAADEQPAVEDIDQVAAPAAHFAEPASEEADAFPAEPAEEPAIPDAEIEESPSDHLAASAALEESAPAEEEVVTDPTALAAELISELDGVGNEIKDPFARPDAEETSEPHEAPASFIDQYAHLMPEEDEPVEAPTPITEPAPVAEEIASSDDSEDDESIDDYMRKLMGRVRGDSPATSESAGPAATPQTAQPVAEPVAAAPAKAPEPVVPIRDLSELKRATKPEIKTDMGALRQLANQSARHAIDVAATKQSREQATLRLTASAVAIGCGALAAITAISPFDLQFAGGVIGVAAGSWFGLRTLRACQAAAQQEELEATTASDSVG